MRLMFPFRVFAPPAIFAFVCLLYFAVDLYLTAKEGKIKEDWDSHLNAATRRQETNGSAEILNGMALKLGIDLEPERSYFKPPDFGFQSEKLENVWDELNHHVRAEAVAAGSPNPTPDETRKFLSNSQENITEIKEHLLHQESPRWRKENPPKTHFLSTVKGVLRLHHLLAADALSHLAEEDSLKSEESVAACWRLNESLRSRDEPISILVALKLSSIQMGLVRKLPSIPSVWKSRIRALEYRKALTTAMSAEAAQLFDSLNEKSVRRQFLTNEFSALPEWGRQPAALLLDPYLRICRLNYLASEKQLILALQNTRTPANLPARENPLLSEYLHVYESMNTTLLEFEKKQKGFAVGSGLH